jgi:hypothetical protein
MPQQCLYKEKKMIHNIPMPITSYDFTIEDIHKIREWIYERLKDATVQERLEEIRRQAEPGIKAIEELKTAKKYSKAI